MGAGGSVVLHRRTVAVVGAGFAGTAFVSRIVRQKWLKRFTRIVLIDKRSSLHHCLASCRAVVQDGWTEKLFLPYKTLIDAAEKQAPGVLQFVQGTVTSINDGRLDVVNAKGDLLHIDFEHLVVATGSQCPFPAKDDDLDIEAASLKYAAALEATESAHRVAIIGGGAVGAELAGEIAFAYPGKDVTLFHSGEALLSSCRSLKPSLAEELARKLVSHGVNLVLGERVDVEALDAVGRDESKTGVAAHLPASVTTGPVMLSTDQGTAWEADVVFRCTGAACNKGAFSVGWLGSAVDSESGRLRVNERLQVVGFENAFAVGDCSALAELKHMYCAVQQAKYVASFLARAAVAKPGAAQTKAYVASPPFILVSLGPKDGCAQLPTGQVVSKGSVVSLGKGKTLLVEESKGMLFAS